MNCGIYKIQSPSGKIYIGSSENLKRRIAEHKRRLSRNIHVNQKLQNAWNKYNGDGFVFSIIILCSKEHTIFYEQQAMDALSPQYNLLPFAGKSTGWKHSKETREKLRVSHLGGPGGGDDWQKTLFRIKREKQNCPHWQNRGKSRCTLSGRKEEENIRKIKRTRVGKKINKRALQKNIRRTQKEWPPTKCRCQKKIYYQQHRAKTVARVDR